MQDGFELLEEKVRKAADLVKKLRRENKALEDDLTKSKWRLQQADNRADGLEKQLQQEGGAGKGDVDALAAELSMLRQEREEVRRRVAKLVDVLDSLD